MIWTDALLAHHRTLGDPLADDVIKAAACHPSIHLDAVWKALRRNGEPICGGWPPEVAAYLDTSGVLPSWADRGKIRVGVQVFESHGPAIVTGLFCSSLPHAYACARGAEVLARTGKMLGGNLRRRIDETAQMVFDVCSDGGLEPEGRGVETLRKVRLIHAVIRDQVRKDATWDVARLGVPINAEDLAGTMLTFSWSTGRAVELLGADLGTDEWEGWLHLWRVVGSLLGVPDALIPADRAETEALWSAIMGRQHAPSLAGRQLTEALVEHMNSYLPGTLWDGTTAELMRTFLGDEVADWLGVPRRNWTAVLLAAERRWYGHADDRRDQSALLRSMNRWFNGELLEAVFFAETKGKKPQFQLPEPLSAGQRRDRRRWARRARQARRMWTAFRT